MSFETDMIEKVTLATAMLRNQIDANISSNNLPKSISDHMTQSPTIQEMPGTFSAMIIITMAQGTPAASAAAFEYGSGVHATRGRVGRYLIFPKNKSMLKFPFSESMNIYPFRDIPVGSEFATNYAPYPPASDLEYTEKGEVFLPYVAHPGVAPRPYIRPAIEEKKADIAKTLVDAIRSEIKIIVREANQNDPTLK